jgi:hypothetical protein
MSALEERRQRAREAAQDEIEMTVDGYGDHEDARRAVDAAVETATRVRITREILAAALEAAGIRRPAVARQCGIAVAAAFVAAGFEVES